ncbi:MAG: hypothetical protein QHC79_17665 [Pseudosphingobacterium sp.]|nr:hypothetical protein [Pseudosphingobacterium sp.]
MERYFSNDLIFTAYKKLKHYFYYDNTTLKIKHTIAEFEREHFLNRNLGLDGIKNKLADRVYKTLEAIDRNEINISPYILPKKFQKTVKDHITNYIGEEEEFVLERINVFADASVEIHIICVLWIMNVGKYLDRQILTNNYAYKLVLEENEELDVPWENLKLYKPYFVQYQEWRDRSIKKAEELLDEGKNVTILSLDIKNYFHSIRLNIKEVTDCVEVEIKKQFQYNKKGIAEMNHKLQISRYLNFVLFKIHAAYYKQLKTISSLELPQDEEEGYSLPVGLMSSGILSNFYLKKFDEQIIEKLNPAFYGRYVDDLMFVFSDMKVKNGGKYTSSINSFLNHYFVRRNILTFKHINSRLKVFFKGKKYIDFHDDLPDLDSSIFIEKRVYYQALSKEQKFAIHDYCNLEIQASKVILHDFHPRESRAALNIFKQKLEQQRSEFRFLPDEDEVSKQFDLEAFSLQYNDSVNKLRSIQEFTEDKYGAAKFLAKKIFARNFGDIEEDAITDSQILTFFKGYSGLEFYSLWEKVATYFVVCKQGSKLVEFKRLIENSIDRIKTLDDKISTETLTDIKDHLKEFMKFSISIPLSLNPDLEMGALTLEEKKFFEAINGFEVSQIRLTNLFRQSLVNIPAINYTSYLKTNNSLLSITLDLKDESGKPHDLTVDDEIAYFAPNYVPFHDVNIKRIFQVVNNLTIKQLKSSVINSEQEDKGSRKDQLIDVINNIPNDAFDDYFIINYKWKSGRIEKDKLKKKYFEITHENAECNKPSRAYNRIKIFSENDSNFNQCNPNKKIAIANIKVEASNVKKSILGRPNVSRQRRAEIFKIINQADKLEADMVVLPEVSVPYSWIRLLAERSHKRNMGIVAGLEHWINGSNFAFNFMVTILPFKVHHYTTSLIKIRLKNHYSHSEKETLRGYRLAIPRETIKSYPKCYDLFHWRKTYFSVYNCFELADISDRALFKSKVDFIIASEFNKDVSYFSDIAGAWVRDVHAFFIQVNTSDFGDSRLIQPSKSYSKDLIQVKGGTNSTVLVGLLDIEELRNFQYMEYNLQKDAIDRGKIDFKPTPPDFDREEVKKRIDNI